MIKPIIFALELSTLEQSAEKPNPLFPLLVEKLNADVGEMNTRIFPDGEFYCRIETNVRNRHCIILANLAYPNEKYLPLIFLEETLREFGALSVGLVTPYLSYMRQDSRFMDGEVVTSKIFAKQISQHFDWLVTIDPHLHRYATLDEIYSIPSKVVQAAPLLAQWLQTQQHILLVGPDAESRQWVEKMATISNHPFIVGEKLRKGDREVIVTLENISQYKDYTAIIIDDVISSGQTILQCIDALKAQQIKQISCGAIHGLFADSSDKTLLAQGLTQLITCNTIPHYSNKIDVSNILIAPIQECLDSIFNSSTHH